MLPAQPLLVFAILYTGRAMFLFVMLNKVIPPLERLHWGAFTTLPLYFLFTAFFLVPVQDAFVCAGNVARNANVLWRKVQVGKEGAFIPCFFGLVNRRNLGIAAVGSLMVYSCQRHS
jgi:hypothetical protein